MIHLLLMMIILNFFSCEGADPILDRASTVEKKPSTPASETKSKPQSNKKPPVQKNKTTDLQKNIVAEVKLPEEEQIVLSGEIIVENWSGERIRVDVFDGDQQSLSGPRPSVVKVEYQNKPGSKGNQSDTTGLLTRSMVLPSHGTDPSGKWILVSVGGRKFLVCTFVCIMICSFCFYAQDI